MKYISLLALMSFNSYSMIEQIKSDFYLSQGMINKADQLMSDHLADHATDPLWLYNTAQCFYEKKDYNQAHFLFKQAAHHDKDNKKGIALKALYQAGNSAVCLNNLEQALQHFEQVTGYVPEHKEALLMIEALKKALEAKKESNNDQKKNDDHNNSESKQEESQSNPASNDDKNKQNNSTNQQHDDSLSKNDKNNHNNSTQQNKQEQSSEPSEIPYNQQDAQKLKEQLEKQQDNAINQHISDQQRRLLKQVQQADKDAQKVMLEQIQSKHTKANAYEPQW